MGRVVNEISLGTLTEGTMMRHRMLELIATSQAMPRRSFLSLGARAFAQAGVAFTGSATADESEALVPRFLLEWGKKEALVLAPASCL